MMNKYDTPGQHTSTSSKYVVCMELHVYRVWSMELQSKSGYRVCSMELQSKSGSPVYHRHCNCNGGFAHRLCDHCNYCGGTTASAVGQPSPPQLMAVVLYNTACIAITVVAVGKTAYRRATVWKKMTFGPQFPSRTVLFWRCTVHLHHVR